MKSLPIILFYLLILFLPTQLGRHFFPDFSFVSGIRVDYLAPTIYLTDIFVLIIFAFWLIELVQSSKFNPSTSSGLTLSGVERVKVQSYTSYLKSEVLVVFLVFLISGILLSKNQGAGLYGFLKLLEFAFLGFYTANNIKKVRLGVILLLLSVGIIFESSLSFIQYFGQGSIGGIFYWFGERAFNSQTPGIANSSLNGALVLRPYGTFPHPNVLAGYLVIAMTLVSSKFNPSTSSGLTLSGVERVKVQSSKFRNTTTVASVIFGTIALFLTMSRVAIALWFIIVGFQGIIYVIKKLKNARPMIHNSSSIIRLLVVLVIIGIIFLFSPLRFRFSDIKLTDESITQRAELIKDSFSMIKSNPILGVGLSNFLVELPSIHKQTNDVFYLQPVHNIYLLILAQTGIVGLIFFLWFIGKTYKRMMNHELGIRDKKSIIHNSTLRLRSGQEFIILSTVLILGMFDHYFLTVQQGQLLFSFVLGLCWSKSSSGRHSDKPR